MIDYDLTKIKGLVFDVDGVLSKAVITVNAEGEPLRTANIKDGYALQLAVKMGYEVAIITGGKTSAVQKRYAGLGIPNIYLGCSVKIKTYEDWLQGVGLQNEEVLYMGDDIPDYEIMKQCGCPCCPKDATIEIQNISTYISPYSGGEGCVRDVVEQVMRAQDKWLKDKKAFGW